MLVMPMLDEAMFLNTINTGDKQKMFDEVKKIGAITSELYKKLTESGVEKNRIDQKIIMIEKKEEDVKFVNWLKEQMPNFVDGVVYSELDNNPIGTEAGANNIFADVAPIPPVVASPEAVAPVVEAVTVPVVESVAQSAPVMNDIFAPNANEVPAAPVASAPEAVVSATPVVETVVSPVVESATQSAPVMNDIFAPNTNEVPAASVASAPEVVAPAAPVAAAAQNVAPVNNPVDNNLFGAPVQANSVPVSTSNNVDGPKPVESTSLDNTMTFTNVAEQISDTTEDTSADGVDDSNKSKGFVNLAILLVVIGVITFISIEIGKYLYNTFGA